MPIKVIQKNNIKEWETAMDQFDKENDCFATQTHVHDGVYTAVIFYKGKGEAKPASLPSVSGEAKKPAANVEVEWSEEKVYWGTCTVCQKLWGYSKWNVCKCGNRDLDMLKPDNDEQLKKFREHTGR